ncbi:hypothetical protein AMTR_s00052p00161510 [Amborella trichopoda]|uniref:Uncharacterized protein n=1 Tax=Amborella trichopoda TaxID=13333 RepID=U5D1X5_AMBTC|nr:hypothetical protein AMTR_s00052p00161510 [Amborella trichopoda]
MSCGRSGREEDGSFGQERGSYEIAEVARRRSGRRNRQAGWLSVDSRVAAIGCCRAEEQGVGREGVTRSSRVVADWSGEMVATGWLRLAGEVEGTAGFRERGEQGLRAGRGEERGEDGSSERRMAEEVAAWLQRGEAARLGLLEREIEVRAG